MHIARTAGEARSMLRSAPRPLGFVPTMGALHAGHMALIDAAKAQSASVAVSIFVNPLQFGPREDFERYPRAFDADCDALRERGVALLYAPPAHAMYPPGFAMSIDVGPIGSVFEGARRPGHFNGVATVMMKLLDAVSPNRFVMGQKDAQQVAMLRMMVRDFDLPYEMLVAPTVRESDGLALSSRNAYLSPQDRAAAPSLYAALRAIARTIAAGETGVPAALAQGRALLDARLRETYLALVDPATFTALGEAHADCLVIGAVAAGSTHLIDNVAVGA